MATTVIIDQTTGGMETSMKLCVSVLIAFLTVTSIWADVVPPCVAQDAATLAGTTCAIADKSFSFGNFVNNTAIVIGFVPDVGGLRVHAVWLHCGIPVNQLCSSVHCRNA